MPRLATFSRLPDSRKLIVADTALNALLNEPDVVAAMATRKYDAARVAQGRKLLNKAADTIDTQTVETGDRLSSTRTQGDRLAEAYALYKPLAETARGLFADDPDVLTALDLTGRPRQRTYEARLARMRAFAVEARKPARLARFTEETTDVDATDFDALEAALDTAAGQISTQDRHTTRSKGATGSRDAAFDALVKWMLKMQGQARVVLKGRLDLLELLGIPQR